ncbi:hypothetical protein B0H10DRAFT_1760682, partial [Mycena sp. CBHHK59/15]
AMNLHIRILLNATSSLDVPAIPNAATVASFQQMFSSAQDIHNHAANISYNHQDTTANITKLRSGAALQPGSTIAKNIAQVDDHILHTIFSAVRHFGLLEWRPDIINGTPGTLYNVMHEVIALKTFQTAAIAGGYIRLSPNLTRLNDMTLLRKFYQSYLFHYLKEQLQKELKTPGKVAEGAENREIYRRRTAV